MMKPFVSLSLNSKLSRKRAIERAATFGVQEEDEHSNRIYQGLSVEDLRRHGNDAALREDYGTALRFWQEALRCDPPASLGAILYEQQAQVFMMLNGREFDAIQSAHKALELRPDLDYGYLTLGRAQLAYGEWEMAIESLQTAVELGLTTAAEDLAFARQVLNEQKREKEEYQENAR